MVAVVPPSPVELPTPPSPEALPLKPDQTVDPLEQELPRKPSFTLQTAASSLDAVVVVDGAGGVKPRARKPAGPTGVRRAVLPVIPPSFTAPPSPPPSDEDEVDPLDLSEDDRVIDAAAAPVVLTQPDADVATGAAAALLPLEPGQPAAPGVAPALPVFCEPFPTTEHEKVLKDAPLAESPTASLAETPDDNDTLPPLPTAASVYDRRPSAVSDRSHISRSLTPTTGDGPHTSYFAGVYGSPSSPRALSTSPTASEGSPQGFLGPAPAFTRRHTTGSPVSISSPLAAAIDGSPSAHSISVPGIDGVRLDTDILSNAEAVRRRRISRRSKKAQSHDDLVSAGQSAPLDIGGPSVDPTRLGGDLGGPGPATARSRLGSMNLTQRRQDPQTKVLAGNWVDEGHSNYILMYDMLTGIRIAVSRTQAKISRSLTDDDFKARHKFSFDIVGNELTPSAKYDFKFKDYAPWVFRDLRDNYFHLDAADYLLSLTAKYILSELGSPGKSGSFFYFSRDFKFIIKTISHAEHRFLRSILPAYHAHVKSNPHTLLSRFYGLHRVKLPRGRKIHFVIMNNLFPPHRDIHETFDLKGSSVGREYPEDKAREKPGAVLKDINWVRRNRILQLGPEKAALLAEQLRRDAEFLKNAHIMDHSLLIGIHRVSGEGAQKDAAAPSAEPDSLASPGPIRRRPSSVKNPVEAIALRKSMQRSEPATSTEPTDVLSHDESSGERQRILFYRDEGGLRATDDANRPLDEIYYLGVIDICTRYSTKKRVEHMWKSLTDDRHAISAIPPAEYGDRFLRFLLSVMPGADKSLRPHGLRSEDVHPPDPADETGNAEHIRHKADKGGKARLKGE